MDSSERMLAVLSGQKPDRPPFSFWYHFAHEQVRGAAAVEAHLRQHRAYQTDFIKVMNDNPYPHEATISAPADLAALHPLRGDEAGFGEQLKLIAALRQQVGDRVLLTTTIFNAWAVLRMLYRPPTAHNPPTLDSADGPSDWLLEVYARTPEHVERALSAIGESLARFAEHCLDAGADGVFLSVRDDWVDRPGKRLYEALVRPSDLRILGAACEGRLNVLHVCGRSLDLMRFNDYPVQVINWADRAAGPSIREAVAWGIRPAICCGVDNLGTLVNGTPELLHREIIDALEQAGSRPMIIAPGCTFDPGRVTPEMLHALAEAVTRARQ